MRESEIGKKGGEMRGQRTDIQKLELLNDSIHIVTDIHTYCHSSILH